MRSNMENELRRAVSQCGKSANELSKETGISQTVISRFLRGSDIGLSRAARIAAHLGLVLVQK